METRKMSGNLQQIAGGGSSYQAQKANPGEEAWRAELSGFLSRSADLIQGKAPGQGPLTSPQWDQLRKHLLDAAEKTLQEMRKDRQQTMQKQLKEVPVIDLVQRSSILNGTGPSGSRRGVDHQIENLSARLAIVGEVRQKQVVPAGALMKDVANQLRLEMVRTRGRYQGKDMVVKIASRQREELEMRKIMLRIDYGRATPQDYRTVIQAARALIQEAKLNPALRNGPSVAQTFQKSLGQMGQVQQALEKDSQHRIRNGIRKQLKDYRQVTALSPETPVQRDIPGNRVSLIKLINYVADYHDRHATGKKTASLLREVATTLQQNQQGKPSPALQQSQDMLIKQVYRLTHDTHRHIRRQHLAKPTLNSQKDLLRIGELDKMARSDYKALNMKEKKHTKIKKFLKQKIQKPKRN